MDWLNLFYRICKMVIVQAECGLVPYNHGGSSSIDSHLCELVIFEVSRALFEVVLAVVVSL